MGRLVADTLNNLMYHFSERLMKDGHINPSRGKNIMVKFEMILPQSELSVITGTTQSTIILSGQTIKIGPHCITFSGVAELAYPDQITLKQLAKDNGDYLLTEYDWQSP
jgi:hypothetical protein